ncbi:MAG TPA: hypothetical protein DD381_10165 [Lentisphaeria bacterium]|nr:MAG: hypothetical protein A2X47_11940 [Lentisphaerae bacterium GWF2_38_69]HBM16689.1 hypothetical protein [Lentisphaeria bacterium]
MDKMDKMDKKIAILGYSFRLPGNLGTDEELWKALIDKKDLITEIPEERFNKSKFFHESKNKSGKSYVFKAGVISEDINAFDAAFFKMPNREVTQVDPQQKLLLMTTWEAFEKSAINPATVSGSNCGVYVGIGSADALTLGAADMSSQNMYSSLGGSNSIAANRISYFFNLKGPSLAIDTACSSALTALHQACLSIRSGETEMAVVGAVNVLFSPLTFIANSQAQMLSQEGRCNSFSNNAEGYVRSEGCISIILKPLEKAIKDGDLIKGVILNTTANSDGATNGLPVPSSSAQCALLKKAYSEIALDCNDISYIEAHGTGTKIGDPTETESISKALTSKRKKFLPIGSIKSNIGHLEAAAGFAGLVKALLCLKHRQIPATINCSILNPDIKFEELKLEVVRELLDLSREEKDIIIGVNAFGFGGSNAHAIISEYRVETSSHDSGKPNTTPDNIPLLITASSETSLRNMASSYAQFLKSTTNDFYNIAYNAFYTRARHPLYCIAYGDSREDIAQTLETYSQKGVENKLIFTGKKLNPGNKIAFVFAGNGCQWPGMGKMLVESSPVIAEYMRQVDEIFKELTDFSLIETIKKNNDNKVYSDTQLAQSALFMIQASIVMYLKSYGISCNAAIGHSVGEIPAAWIAGVLTLEEAVKLIYFRSKAQAKTRGLGKMAVLGKGHQETQAIIKSLKLGKFLEVSGINSPELTTISGLESSLRKIQHYAESKEIYFKFLDIDYPFHSRIMDRVKDEFIKDIENLLLPRKQQGNVDFISTVSGVKFPTDSLNAEYWWDNLRRPVNFQSGIECLVSDGFDTFIEISTHPILLRSIEQSLGSKKNIVNLIPSLKRDSNELHDIHDLLFKLVVSGVPFNENKWFPLQAPKTILPCYSWDKKVYKPVTTIECMSPVAHRIEHPLLGWRITGSENIWENHIDATNCGDIADHIVGEAIVYPAACFIEAAIGIYSITNSAQIGIFDKLMILAPITLDKDVTLLLQLQMDDNGYFTLRSRPRLTNLDWTTHAKGRLLKNSNIQKLHDRYCKTNEIRQHVGVRITSEKHYELASAAGLIYKNKFQTIEEVLIDGDTVFIEFKDNNGSFPDCNYQPPYIDGGFQSIFSLIWKKEEIEGSVLSKSYLPISVDSIVFLNKQNSIKRAVNKFNHISPFSANSDIYYYDNENNLVLILYGARCIAAQSLLISKKIPALWESIPYLLHNYNTPLLTNALNNKVISAFQKFRVVYDPKYNQLNLIFEQLIISYLVETMKRLSPSDIVIEKGLFGRKIRIASVKLICELLKEEGYLNAKSDALYSWIKGKEILPSEEIYNLLLERYSEAFPEILYFGRIGLNLEKILLGSIAPDELVTLDGGMYTKFIESSILARPVSESLKSALTNLLEKLKTHEKINILEIGEGLFANTVMSIATDENLENLNYQLLTYNKDTYKGIHDRKFNVTARLIDETESFKDLQPSLKFNLIICTDLQLINRKKKSFKRILDLITENGILLVHDGQPCLSQWFMNGLKPYNYKSFLQKLESSCYPYGETYWRTYFEGFNLDHLNTYKDANQNETIGSFTSLFLNKINKKTVVSKIEYLSQKSVLLIYSDGSADHENINRFLSSECQIFEAYNYKTPLKKKTDFSKYDEIFILPEKDTDLDDTSLDLLIMEIIRRIARNNDFSRKPCLNLITSGGALCNGRKNLVFERNPKHASLWALMRVVYSEYSSYINFRLIDLQNELLQNRIADVMEYKNNELVLTDKAVYAIRVIPYKEKPEPYKLSKDKIIALNLEKKGSFDYIKWKEKNKDVLKDNQVAIKPVSVGLNFRDIMYTLGLMPEEAVEAGAIGGGCLGLEGSGIVIETGKKVKGFKPGERVIAGAPPSFFTSYITVNQENLLKLPDNWTYEEGATFFITYMTAYYSLVYLAQLKKGEKILIHAASGGVGLAAIQIAKYLGAEVYATAGNGEKRDFLESIGIKNVYDSRTLYFSEQIMEDTNGEGMDVILNSLSGDAIDINFKVLKYMGRFVEIGKRDIYENKRLEMKSFSKSISFFYFDLELFLKYKKDIAQHIFTELNDLINKGIFKPLPYVSFPVTQIKEAFKFLKDGKSIGKVVVNINQNDLSPDQSLKEQKKFRGSYLLTGGTGGFGLEIAKYLVEKGVKSLILVSRSGKLDAESSDYFKNKEIKLKVYSGNVSSYVQMEEIFNKIRKERIELKGILHAAAIYKDDLIENMSSENYYDVLMPKIKGASHLDLLSRDYDLDHFILISSVTVLLGNIGQANYVAGNGFMESLILLRRKAGLTGNYLALGGIGDVGYIQRNQQLKKLLSDKLGNTMTKEQAIMALDSLISSNHPGYVAMDWDIQRMSDTLPSVKTERFDPVRKLHSQTKISSDVGNFKEYINSLTPAEAKNELQNIVAEEAASLLGISLEDLKKEKSLKDYGLDSLMGFDLVMSLEKRTGIKMSNMALPQQPNIIAVTEMLLLKLNPTEDKGDN